MRDFVKLHLRAVTGKKEPVLEAEAGSEIHKKTGKYVYKERLIDRQDDRYRERIIDETTGKLIHQCDEPLTEHQNHGSAKRAKRMR